MFFSSNFNNYIFFLCALLNIKYIFLFLAALFFFFLNQLTCLKIGKFLSVSEQLLLVLQVQSQRSKLTSLSPASDLFQMLKWYVNHTDLLKHRCTGCRTHEIVSTLVNTWILMYERKRQHTEFSRQLHVYSIQSWFSQPLLFQCLGRMSLVQLRILIWLTIPPPEREREGKRKRGREMWRMLGWDRFASWHGIGWVLYVCCTLAL